MQTIKSEAIILRRTNYGEADRILNLLTPEHGKVSAIAKSIRKSKSKLAGGLELFATCDVTIMQGKTDMGVVTSARLVRFYGKILHDYDRMQLGYDCIKRINKATETVAESEFYYLLRDSFMYLDAASIDYRLVEVWFGLRLATALGVAVNLATDVQGKTLQPTQRYNFDFTDMAFALHPSGQFTADHIKLLRLLQAKNPAIVRQVSGAELLLDDCIWLVRALQV